MRELALSGEGLDQVLVVGAHSDDIEIGCGGTLLHLARANPDLEFVWVVLPATALAGLAHFVRRRAR